MTKICVLMAAIAASVAATFSVAAERKGDYSCRFYTKTMEQYRAGKKVVPSRAPREMQYLAGLMDGSYFAATRHAYSDDSGADFERFVQKVFKECKSAPTADAREIVVRLSRSLESGEKVVPSKDDPEWQTKSIAELEKEPGIVEVLFPNGASGSLWVSMRDDGSRRDGFAEYVCLKLHESGLPKRHAVMIHVYDAAAMARGHMNEIGSNICEFVE